MRRAFPTLLLLTIALAWPAVARAQTGCAATYAALSAASEGRSEPNPKTGEPEDHIVYHGPANFTCNDIRILADELDLAVARNVVTATGNVIFIQQGTRIAAERAEFDLKNKTGVFYVASGSLALQNKPGASPTDHSMDKSLFGNVEPDAYFYGDKIEKLGPRTYQLTHGGFTTCVQPTPRWQMSASTMLITVNDHVMLRNMVLRVKDVPVFYVPALYYPIHGNERATGILMPIYGSSTVKGFTLSNAFFWAITRSQDLTLYHEWYSKAGQGLGSEYRYVGDSASSGHVLVNEINQTQQLAADGTTVVLPAQREYQVVGDLSQTLSKHVRLQGSANYFSSVTTQQLLQQGISELSNRDSHFGMNIYGTWGSARVSGQTQVDDYFYGTQATRYGSAPRINFSYGPTPIGHSRVYVSLGSEFVSILRQAVVGDPTTDQGLSRIDFNPSIRAPIGNLPFLQINTSAQWRFTSWSQSLNPSGVQVAAPVSRRLFVLQASVTGPTFKRIFDTPRNGYADKFKHTIEPTLTVNRVTSFDSFNQIVKLDGTDTIVGGATTLTYGLNNRISAEVRQPNGTSVARDIVTVGLSQSYYTDQNAAAYDQQYQSSEHGRVPSKFSPIALDAQVHPTDRITGMSRVEYDWQNRAIRSLSAGTNVSLTMVNVNANYTRWFLIPELPGFDVAAALAHALNVSTSVKAPDSHLTFTHSWNYDFTHAYMLQQRIASTYNTQCCGIAFEYQTVYLGNLGPRGIVRDRRFNISFTLAGLGTFQNPMGAFGGSGVK